MRTAKTRTGKLAATLGMTAVAALVSVASGSATAAPLAPTLYTETSLNLNSSLAANLSGFVVAAPPNASDSLQKWEAAARFVTLPDGQLAFGWQLKNSATKKCVSDGGANLRVKETTCEGSPGSATKQVWQNVGGKSVGGKFYWFWENATTHRRLQVSGQVTDGVFPTFTVIASDQHANPGTALEALQLWNERVVS
ncbi:MAG: hypothetical protein ABW215_20630 [Kibdelosporangium sp.]